jgi:hypothetical protein
VPENRRAELGESRLNLEPSIDAVIHFYETHPINEYEILEKLRADRSRSAPMAISRSGTAG